MAVETHGVTTATPLHNRQSHSSALEIQRSRNLTNQRNFRSRRRQYIEELERRLRQYEQAGVVATKQVQAAAQIVAAENASLRTLVRTQLGWSEQELDHYISQGLRRVPAQFPGQGWNTGQACSCQRKLHLPTEGGDWGITQHVPNVSVQDPPTPHEQSNREFDRSEPKLSWHARASHTNIRDMIGVSRALSPVICNSDSREKKIEHQRTPTSETQSEGTKCGRTACPEATFEEVTPGTFMSCDQAAKIISELRIQDNLELVRQELGCTSTNTCKVTHRDLFQRMDESL